MEGKSGSLVLIGYFAAVESSGIPRSSPIVVKSRSRKDGRLREEYDSAESVKAVIKQTEHFAVPIDFDASQEDYDVLWSLFIPRQDVDPTDIEAPSALENDDLRTPLNEGDEDSAKRILDTTFAHLRSLHLPSGAVFREGRQMEKEYRWYLRNLDSWADDWRQVWGSSEVERVHDAGGDFANPFRSLEKALLLTTPMSIGTIHGDLHPGNVVLKGEVPYLIDFGWAQAGAHIAKDFVLMECNLRFHTLRAQLSQRDVHALSDWVEWDARVPSGMGVHVRKRAELICHLRETARRTLSAGVSEEIDWNREYVVPLFIVALGMLRFAPLLGNQQAAVRFVLSLANVVDQSQR
jgi:aminoglycoside phosphotransferase (APT) family kinase protein